MVLAVGVCLLGIPPASHAVIINNITVNNGQVGGNFTGGAAGTTWTFAPINLGPGQSLVLTQNQNQLTSSLPTGLPGFNFDTSENAGVAAICGFTGILSGRIGMSTRRPPVTVSRSVSASSSCAYTLGQYT